MCRRMTVADMCDMLQAACAGFDFVCEGGSGCVHVCKGHKGAESVAYLELAQLVKDGLHHSQWLIIISAPASDLIYSQTHEVVMYAHQ